MMTSSGSGAYRVGGSGTLSSTSNLSALAPPFKVDKPLQKPNPTNPSVTYPDVPMYGAYFEPASTLWNSSSSSAPGMKFGASESNVSSTTAPTSPSMYGYTGSQPNTTPAGAYYVSSGVGVAYDPFSYEPFPKSISTSVDKTAKPYYPPYVSPPPQKDGYLSLGVGSGHGYDLLSTSGSTQLSGCGYSQVDSQRGISGDGEYKPNWGGFWNGLNESEHEKWPECAQGCGSKDIDICDVSSNNSRPFVDGSNKSQPFVDIKTDPFVVGSTSIHLPSDGSTKSHLKQDGCFDIFGEAYHLGSLGIDQQDSRLQSEFYSMMPSSVSERMSKESPHLQEPAFEPVTSFCGSQNSKCTSTQDQFSQTGFYEFGCTSATSNSPIIVAKSPYGGCSSSTGSSLPALELDTAYKSNTFAGYTSFYQKESQMPLGSKRQYSAIIRRPVSSMLAFPSQVGEIEGSSLDGKAASEKNTFAPQVPHQLSTGGFSLDVNDGDAVYSADKHSGGSDIHNPAEDSPCWKGASSNRFSPFTVSEGVASDVLVEKLDECRSPSTQDHKVKSLVDTSDSRVFASPKSNERTLLQRPPDSDCVIKESEGCHSANPKYYCFDLNSGDGFQFGNDSYVSTKQCCIVENSKTDSDTLNSMYPLSKGGEVSSPTNMSEAAAVGNSGNCPLVVADVTAEGVVKVVAEVMAEMFSGEPSSIDKSPASSPVADKTSLNYCQPTSKSSDSKIDVNVLLKTMIKLSEIFRCYCSENQAAVQEQRFVAIKHIISNLNASMLMMGGQTTQTMRYPDGLSTQKELPVTQMVNDAEAVAAAVSSGTTAEDILDSVSFKDDADTIGDANMIEAIKKILTEKIPDDNLKEEMDQEKFLYRNLWLEAEASLCAMTAKARFLRVKTEMERTHDVTKERENSPASIISVDVSEAVELATKNKDSTTPGECPKLSGTSQTNHTEESEVIECHMPKTQVGSMMSADYEVQKLNKNEICSPSWHALGPTTASIDSDGSGTTSHANVVETSVLARYQLLKNRVENSETEKHQSEPFSGGYKDSLSSYASGNNSHCGGANSGENNDENPVLARYHILKCRPDNSDNISYDCNRSPGEENFLPDNDYLSPTYPVLDCQVDNSDSLYEGKQSPREENNVPDTDSRSSEELFPTQLLSNSVNVPEKGEASVMARFRIIQSRVNRSKSVKTDESLGQTDRAAVNGGNEGLGLVQQKSNLTRFVFGPYPDLTEDQDVNQLGFCAKREAYLTPSCKANRLDSGIFESWYDDCSSSDWEHISKEDVRKQY